MEILVTLVAVYDDLGEISSNTPPKSHPTSHPKLPGLANPLSTFLCTWRGAMESLVMLAITGAECITNKQTDRQTFFFIYIDSISLYD